MKDQSQGQADGEPLWVTTRYGVEFDARADVWPINGSQSLEMGPLRAAVAEPVLAGLEAVLRDAAGRYAPATLSLWVHSLKHYARTTGRRGMLVRWDFGDLRRYGATLLKEFGHQDYLRHIRSVLNAWFAARVSGVSKELVDRLGEMRLKGAETGRAVRVLDPDKGPLSSDEEHHLVEALNDAAERGEINLSDYSLVYLHFLTGRRPKQTADLKCKDVVKRLGAVTAEHPGGEPLRLLQIPRAKQKGQGFRETLRAIDLSPDYFLLYQAQRDAARESFCKRLRAMSWDLQDRDLAQALDDLPLYPHWGRVDLFLSDAKQFLPRRHAAALKALKKEMAGAALHNDPSSQSHKIVDTCRLALETSPSQVKVNVSAIRLRYTKGTSLARSGVPKDMIAWLLDHSTSRSADIYVDNLPEHAAQINAALAKSPTMQRFASAFRGTVVDSEAQAVGGDEPTITRINVHGKGAATCGQRKQCGLGGGIPRACYTCFHFQPWVDGPHEDFLAGLLAERAEDVNALGADSPVAQRHDKVIAAVENVIHICRVRRAELAEEVGGQPA